MNKIDTYLFKPLEIIGNVINKNCPSSINRRMAAIGLLIFGGIALLWDLAREKSFIKATYIKFFGSPSTQSKPCEFRDLENTEKSKNSNELFSEGSMKSSKLVSAVEVVKEKQGLTSQFPHHFSESSLLIPESPLPPLLKYGNVLKSIKQDDEPPSNVWIKAGNITSICSIKLLTYAFASVFHTNQGHQEIIDLIHSIRSTQKQLMQKELEQKCKIAPFFINLSLSNHIPHCLFNNLVHLHDRLPGESSEKTVKIYWNERAEKILIPYFLEHENAAIPAGTPGEEVLNAKNSLLNNSLAEALSDSGNDRQNISQNSTNNTCTRSSQSVVYSPAGIADENVDIDDLVFIVIEGEKQDNHCQAQEWDAKQQLQFVGIGKKKIFSDLNDEIKKLTNDPQEISCESSDNALIDQALYYTHLCSYRDSLLKVKD